MFNGKGRLTTFARKSATSSSFSTSMSSGAVRKTIRPPNPTPLRAAKPPVSWRSDADSGSINVYGIFKDSTVKKPKSTPKKLMKSNFVDGDDDNDPKFAIPKKTFERVVKGIFMQVMDGTEVSHLSSQAIIVLHVSFFFSVGE
uniref:Uncharacterized protein n=1 Tax=Panagrolaimus sp. JU765 TaxID=591449 RepID=A0AC34RN53_9BILA